ncbi:MAG: hypothetical protein GY856_29840 [bacterium]|nr:hypothetical protein [bacterium]
MDINLKLINQSHDINNSSIVIFQKNVAECFDELALAWRVITNLGFQDYHPFKYPMHFRVGGGDAWGNFTPDFAATNGQRWEMIRDNTGDVLKLSSMPAESAEEVEIFNALPRGGISGHIYRDGKLLAKKTNISPGQKAVFKFLPKIFIGVVSQIEEGDVMDSAIISNINTEINLLGVRNADIIMTGGGGGPDASQFQFNLANVNK